MWACVECDRCRFAISSTSVDEIAVGFGRAFFLWISLTSMFRRIFVIESITSLRLVPSHSYRSEQISNAVYFSLGEIWWRRDGDETNYTNENRFRVWTEKCAHFLVFQLIHANSSQTTIDIIIKMIWLCRCSRTHEFGCVSVDYMQIKAQTNRKQSSHSAIKPGQLDGLPNTTDADRPQDKHPELPNEAIESNSYSLLPTEIMSCAWKTVWHGRARSYFNTFTAGMLILSSIVVWSTQTCTQDFRN